MELQDFYSALLPANGLYALFSVPHKRHVWASSIDELVLKTNERREEPDWYFATAAFTEKRRLQDCVRAKRCFYFDIDAGEAKFAKDPRGTYKTQRDAASAVIEFASSTGLSPTTVVASGSGLHVYYALDADCGLQEWNRTAKVLGAFAKRLGLRVDPACTTDAARVLRPIGSLHKSGRTVRPLVHTGKVWSLTQINDLVGFDEPASEEPASWWDAPNKPKLDTSVNDALKLWEPQPASAQKAAAKCMALNDIAAAKGDVPEPQWRAMLGVVKFSIEGSELAHEWSCGYDGYSEEETQAKFDRYEGTGPTLCTTFERFSYRCEECEYRGKISSPLALGNLTVKQVAALPPEQLPPSTEQEVPEGTPIPKELISEGFRVERRDGRLILQGKKTVEVENLEGETERKVLWVTFTEDMFWVDGWTDSGKADSDSSSVSLHLWRHGKVSTYDMPASVIATRTELLKFLAGKSITCSSPDNATTALMHTYVNDQYRAAKTSLSRKVIRSRFGIQFEHDGPSARLMCAHGRYVIWPDGSIEESIIGRKLLQHRSMFCINSLPPSSTGQWDASVWKNHVLPAAQVQAEFYRKYYTRPSYEVSQLAIMMSLASPLLVFIADTEIRPGAQLPGIGLTVSLYSSGTGKGKTSMQRAAAAAFGVPAEMVLSGSKQDATPVYQSALAAALGTMPYFLDEVTQNGPQEVAELVNRLANGSDRRRADRSGAARDSNTWALIAQVSTNIPQREMLAGYQKASDALQLRLLELVCDFPDVRDGGHIQFDDDWDTMMAPNFGSLGAVIHMAIMQLGVAKMRSMLRKRFEEAVKHIQGATQRERFLQRGMACALAAHDLLKALGVTLFDRDMLMTQYSRAAKDAVDYSTLIARAPDDLMRKMVSDMAPHIAVTQNYEPREGVLDPILNQRFFRSPAVGRRVISQGITYLLVDAAKEWARDNQISYAEMIRQAKVAGTIRPGMTHAMDVARGTEYPTVAGRCMVINDRALFGALVDGAAKDNVVPINKNIKPEDNRDADFDGKAAGDK